MDFTGHKYNRTCHKRLAYAGMDSLMRSGYVICHPPMTVIDLKPKKFNIIKRISAEPFEF